MAPAQQFQWWYQTIGDSQGIILLLIKKVTMLKWLAVDDEMNIHKVTVRTSKTFTLSPLDGFTYRGDFGEDFEDFKRRACVAVESCEEPLAKAFKRSQDSSGRYDINYRDPWSLLGGLSITGTPMSLCFLREELEVLPMPI